MARALTAGLTHAELSQLEALCLKLTRLGHTMNSDTFRLVVVSAGTGDPSSTRLLADRTADRVVAQAARHGHQVTVSGIQLRDLSADISTALTSPLITPSLRQAIAVLGESDGLIAATPVYNAGASGLTSLFAAPEDWADTALGKRVDRAALELVLLMESGFARKVRDESWDSYQHEFGSAAQTQPPIDFTTDLMRLAAGGSAR